MEAYEVIVDTPNRDTLDQTMLHFGGLTGSQRTHDGYWPVRGIAPTKESAQARADFIRYVLESQGYGRYIRTEEL